MCVCVCVCMYIRLKISLIKRLAFIIVLNYKMVEVIYRCTSVEQANFLLTPSR